MGVATASQAFDSEKLDMDKFASLGPNVLKKDELEAITSHGMQLHLLF